MRHRKLTLNKGLLVILWVSLFFGAPVLVGLILKIVTYASLWGELIKQNLFIPSVIYILLYIAAYFIWRRSTFRRSDFISFCHEKGASEIRIINRLKGHEYFMYSAMTCRIDDFYCACVVDHPFFIFTTPSAKYIDGVFQLAKTPKTLDDLGKVSTVDFMARVNTSVDVDIWIKPDSHFDSESTGAGNEIESLLKEQLKEAKDLYAHLTVKDNVLRLSVIGGSWLGGSFIERINDGFSFVVKLCGIKELGCFPNSSRQSILEWNHNLKRFELLNSM